MTQATDFYAQMLESQRRASEERGETRAALLSELRAFGVTSIEVRRRVEDFGWDFAYALSPGFENNEGGYGELTWALETDKIDVSHSNRYIETNTTEHEGL